jgi:uncharacterized membrane protein
MVPLHGVPEPWKIAAALCARHIGGAVNYVAVAETLATSPEAVMSGLAADNVVVAAYFTFLFAITRADPETQESSKNEDQLQMPIREFEEQDGQLSLGSLSIALSLSLLMCLVAEVFSIIVFKGRVSSIPVATGTPAQ